LDVFCAFCGKKIPAEIIKKRHYTQAELRERPIYCNHDEDNARRKRDGIFKEMSLAGREGRKRVIPQSNKEKPRRQRKA